MKILITGSNGQLGRDCQVALGADHELVCLGHDALDISAPPQVRRWLRETKPDVVVNCAAYTAVDAAETDSERCFQINATGPEVLAAACTEIAARLVHISTDYVFDGTLPKGQSYTEDMPANPLSVYGASKLAGEKPVLQYERGIVLRTAWLYGDARPSFLQAVLRRALANPETPLRVVDDQHGAPTWSGRLARQIAHLLREDATGLYHAAAHGTASWYEVARTFFELLGIRHVIEPIPTSAYPTPAIRPSNSSLENRGLATAGLDTMICWRRDLAAFTELYGEYWIKRMQL